MERGGDRVIQGKVNSLFLNLEMIDRSDYMRVWKGMENQILMLMIDCIVAAAGKGRYIGFD